MTETPTLDMDKLAALRDSGFEIGRGGHSGGGFNDDGTPKGACSTELISWGLTGHINDMPDCVHPTIARFIQQSNDRPTTTNEEKWRMVLEVGPVVVGSNEWEHIRAAVIIAEAGRTVDGLLASIHKWSGADLHGADLRGADLRGAVLHGADLHGAVLRGADLSGAVLHGADLRGADLRGADLRGADLRGAVLHGAVLRGAVLRGAVANEWSLWPSGFDPRAAGVLGLPEAKP